MTYSWDICDRSYQHKGNLRSHYTRVHVKSRRRGAETISSRADLTSNVEQHGAASAPSGHTSPPHDAEIDAKMHNGNTLAVFYDVFDFSSALGYRVLPLFKKQV